MDMMPLRILLAAMLVGPGLTSCEKAQTNPSRQPIGPATTQLGVRVGSIWGGGYSVAVFPGEYAVVEHESCPAAKEPGPMSSRPKGICVVRLTQAESDKFEVAMDKFKRSAIPLQSIAADDPWVRPDLKPCKSEATDHTMITLTWTGTSGVKMATFYTGCDQEELAEFYKSVLEVTDALPLQDIIRKR
jgi:hypothetical protein